MLYVYLIMTYKVGKLQYEHISGPLKNLGERVPDGHSCDYILH